MFLLLKVKRPVPTRSMKKACTKNLVLQIDRGNLINCLKTPVLSKLTMDRAICWAKQLKCTQWKNKLFLKEIVTLRYSTRTTSSTVQSTRRTSTSTFQDNHILQWNNHMASTFEIWFRRSRTTLSDKHFDETYDKINHLIPSVKNPNKWFMKLETLNCVNYSMLNPKHNAKYACRIGTSALSTARAGTSCEMERKRTRGTSSSLLTSFRFPTITSRKGDPTATVTGRKKGREEARGSRVLHRELAQEELLEETFLGYSRPVHPWWEVPQEHDWIGSQWRSDSWDGQIGKRRSHAPHHSRWNSSLSKQLVDPFEHGEFCHDAHKASSWFQTSLNNFATAQDLELASSETTTSGTWRRTTTCSSPSTTPMTMLTSTNAWCTPCALSVHVERTVSHCDDTSHLIGSSPEETLCHPRSYPWCVLIDSTSPFFLFLPVILRLLPPQRAVLWPRQPDRHGKPVLLRQQGEWGHPERLPLLHRLWAQCSDLRRAQRLISHLLLHDPVLGPRHGWRDTRQDAHRGTPRTRRLLRTRRRVSQSVVVVCKVRWIRAT